MIHVFILWSLSFVRSQLHLKGIHDSACYASGAQHMELASARGAEAEEQLLENLIDTTVDELVTDLVAQCVALLKCKHRPSTCHTHWL